MVFGCPKIANFVHQADNEGMKVEKTSSDSVRAVDRALAILSAFTAQDKNLTAGELLSRVNLSRPTLYRLLHSLEHSGHIVSATPGDGQVQRFRLGPAIGGIAKAWAATQDITVIAQPYMQRLWQQTQETVSLFVRQHQHRLCVAEIQSPQALSFKRGVGYREKIALGASGQVILAYADSTPDSAIFKQIRKQGFAVSNSALIEGATAIAAPVFDKNQVVCGSIAVFGPSLRLPPSKVSTVATLAMRCAAGLSAAM
jgi:IclR family transcriptional regulator, acetate operon repressor